MIRSFFQRAFKLPQLHYKFSQSQIQQRKPTAAQLNAQREGLMSKLKLDHQYKMINSSPNDSIDEVQYNFINIKKKLNDKRVYIPNKAEYLRALDEAYDQVVANHEVFSRVELTKPSQRATRSQIITYQLEKLRRVKYLEAIQSYQFAALLLFAFITIEIVIEEYGADKNTERLSISGLFQLGALIKDISKKVSPKMPTLQEYTKELQNTTTLQAKLLEFGIKMAPKPQEGKAK